MSQPPESAPAAVATTPAIESRPLAIRSCAGGTISGVSALLAGRKSTLQVKRAKTSANTGAVLPVPR